MSVSFLFSLHLYWRSAVLHPVFWTKIRFSFSFRFELQLAGVKWKLVQTDIYRKNWVSSNNLYFLRRRNTNDTETISTLSSQGLKLSCLLFKRFYIRFLALTWNVCLDENYFIACTDRVIISFELIVSGALFGAGPCILLTSAWRWSTNCFRVDYPPLQNTYLRSSQESIIHSSALACSKLL